MGIVRDHTTGMKQVQFFVFFSLFCLGSFLSLAQTPTSFKTHKVKKGETLELILDSYGIDEVQLQEYNPSVERFGVRRRMNLRIPVYSNLSPEVVPAVPEIKKDTSRFVLHEVAPKETKWH